MLSVDDLAPFLRDPVTRTPVELSRDAAAVPATGVRYLREGNYIDFIGGEVAESSQKHYERHPFDVLKLDDPQKRIEAVDKEIREILPGMPREAMIIDSGCGTGRISIGLREMGYGGVLALDLSRRALRALQERIDIPGLRVDNLNLPLVDGFADLVVSTGVVHHTPDPKQAIAENCRVLKPGGKLFLKVFNRDGYYRFMYVYLGGFLRALRRLGPPGRWIVNGIFRPVYVLIRGAVASDPVPKENLNALFENYFMKDTTSLMRKSEVDAILATSRMKILDYKVQSTMHCYIAEKRGDRSG